jgi:CRISPR-associated protein Cmr1
MERETFQVELVTPCFLAGAEGTTEWRAASIRGQLRWWFRAVAGGRWKGDLDRVRREEARLFGSTERKSFLRVQALESPVPIEAQFGRKLLAADLAALYREPSAASRLKIMGQRGEEGSNPLHYLAFGPVAKGRLERQYLPPSQKASFELQWAASSPRGEAREVFDKALAAWFSLGGLGAKNRKGFGSLQPGSNKWYRAPASREAWKDQARQILAEARAFEGRPAWTHLSSRTRIFLASDGAKKWDEALEWLGAWLIGFRRRYGSSQDSRIFDGLPLANRDYEWAAPKGQPQNARKGVPDRSGFGLPLPFRRKVGEQVRGETVIWGVRKKDRDEERGKEQDSRRASPLLLHVSKLDGLYIPVITYIPAEFLPAGGQLKFKGPYGGLFDPTPQQLAIIDHFLGDLLKKNLIQEVVP